MYKKKIQYQNIGLIIIYNWYYSRLFEQEADEQALKILMDNHLNPNGMINLFEHLEKEDKAAIPKIISTHPLTKERLANMKKIIAKSAFKINPNPKLQAIFDHIKN